MSLKEHMKYVFHLCYANILQQMCYRVRNAFKWNFYYKSLVVAQKSECFARSGSELYVLISVELFAFQLYLCFPWHPDNTDNSSKLSREINFHTILQAFNVCFIYQSLAWNIFQFSYGKVEENNKVLEN